MSGQGQKKTSHASPLLPAKEADENKKGQAAKVNARLNEHEQPPPVYWSVIHHKNVHDGLNTHNKSPEASTKHKKNIEQPPGQDNVPDVIHERQPLNNVSSRSVLTGYDSTSSTPPVSSLTNLPMGLSSGSDISGKKNRWIRVKESVDSGEIFVKHIPEMTERGNSQPTMKWSDLDEVQYEFTLGECLKLFIAVLAIGALAFSYVFEQWSIIDSVYFTAVLLTTVGYGDVSPTTQGGKLFASVFALGGIVLLGLALGVVGSQLVEAEISYTEEVKSKTSKALESAFTGSMRHRRHNEDRDGTNEHDLETASLARSDSTSSLNSIGSNSTCSFESNKTGSHSSKLSLSRSKRYETSRWPSVVRRHLPGFAPILVGGLVISPLEKWGFVDAIYYSVVTSTTIGFGDLTPQHPISKLAAIVFVPLMVAAMGYILGNVATFIVEKRRSKYMNKLWSTELKVEDIQVLDKSGDGGVSELEYIKFMLVAMHKIDGSLFDELHDQFQELDVTGNGQIMEKDLKMMAKSKMRKVRRKLELRAYKRKLKKEKITPTSVMLDSVLAVISKTPSTINDDEAGSP